MPFLLEPAGWLALDDLPRTIWSTSELLVENTSPLAHPSHAEACPCCVEGEGERLIIFIKMFTYQSKHHLSRCSSVLSWLQLNLQGRPEDGKGSNEDSFNSCPSRKDSIMHIHHSDMISVIATSTHTHTHTQLYTQTVSQQGLVKYSLINQTPLPSWWNTPSKSNHC